MNFKISILLLSLNFFTCIAQKEIVSMKMGDKTSKLEKKEGYNFFNTETGDLAICLVDKKIGVVNLFDKDFKVISTLTFESPKYDNLLGYKIIGNTYEILFSNNSNKKFAVVRVNFDSKKVSQEDFKFDFGDEKYLETIHYNNQLFLLTANRANDFTIREFKNKSFSTLKKISLSSEKYNSILLNVDNFGGLTSNLIKIDNRVPNAIEQTASKNKLYQKDNLFYLSIEDLDSLQTILYNFDLESLTMEKNSFKYPKGNIGDFQNYNSFILDDKIFQLGSSNDEMKITVKGFDGEDLKEFYIKSDKPIDFKNSPIIQDGQTFIPLLKSRRELEETSKYLKKISSGKIGITGFKEGNLYNFAIGGYKEIASNHGIMTNGGYRLAEGPAGFHYTFNPTYYSFFNYNATKSTFFNTHLDEDLNYVPKDESENIFDRVKKFKKEIKLDTAEDIFVYNGKIYISSYDSGDKTLSIVEM